MKNAKKPVFWESTRLQGLVRRHNGVYYARSFVGRREKWKSLRTTLFSVAEARLAEHQREGREHRALTDAAETGDLTFGQAIDLYLARLKMDVDRKSSTKRYHEQVIISILRDWPDLKKRELRRVTRIDCLDWAERHATRTSATRYNAALGIFRAVLNIGIERGAIVNSPAATLKRRAVRAKRAELPTREKFIEMLEVIRNGGARFSKACADFVAGLAFTGMRIGEAKHLVWRDIEFHRRLIHVRGAADTATKNWETRFVPIVTDAEQLFTKMRDEYPDTSPEKLVFLVHEAQKSLDRAAKKVGVVRITHHGLRHLFATICIESGVDIPTISRWLGHKDGGVLAMRVYGHLRQEHSIAAACSEGEFRLGESGGK